MPFSEELEHYAAIVSLYFIEPTSVACIRHSGGNAGDGRLAAPIASGASRNRPIAGREGGMMAKRGKPRVRGFKGRDWRPSLAFGSCRCLLPHPRLDDLVALC